MPNLMLYTYYLRQLYSTTGRGRVGYGLCVGLHGSSARNTSPVRNWVKRSQDHYSHVSMLAPKTFISHPKKPSTDVDNESSGKLIFNFSV